MPTLAFGDYEPADHSISKSNARTEFLEAVRKYNPEVLQTLASTPFQSFIDAGLHQVDFRRLINIWGRVLSREFDQWPDARMISWIVPQDLSLARLRFLRMRLEEWAKNYCLLAPWVLERAFYTLLTWSECDHFRGLEWFHGSTGWKQELNPPLTINIERWDHYLMTEKDFIKLARTKFEKELHDYLSGVKAALDKCSQTSRSLQKNDTNHIHWLALFVVGNKKLRQIKNLYSLHCPDQTISKGIHDAALLIDLPVPNRQGRPGKNST
jgi:hypothetical protein